MSHASTLFTGSPHPLGPLLSCVPARFPNRARVIAGVILAILLGVLGTAASLEPDSSGVGTHEALGLPTCTVLSFTGYPCPTCGMTTAFANAVRGRWRAAFAAQPFGLLLAFGAMLGVMACVTTLITGRCWTPNWYRIRPERMMAFVVVLFLAGWCYKIWELRGAGSAAHAASVVFHARW